MVDIGDACMAIMDLSTVRDALLRAGLAPPASRANAPHDAVLSFQSNSTGGGEVPPSPELSKALDDLAEDASRADTLLYLFETAIESGQARLTAEITAVVKDALTRC